MHGTNKMEISNWFGAEVWFGTGMGGGEGSWAGGKGMRLWCSENNF